MFSVNVADTEFVEQTINHFHITTEIDQEHLDEDLVERIQANCFRLISLKVDSLGTLFAFLHVQFINIPI